MDEKITCGVCMHHCRLAEGQTGRCRARGNQNGRNVPTNYGILTALALDPIEKKPLRRFHPGSRILSVGSFGCNLSCPFCQNHGISQVGADIQTQRQTRQMEPAELAGLARELAGEGNIGVAYTYNEPLVGYEFVRDTAREVHAAGMKNVIVTNGSVAIEFMEELFPVTDAMNIDLKGFTEECYRRLGGNLAMVCRMIERAARECHVELTSLIVPGLNDSPEDFRRQAEWIAGVDEQIPLHITRYFPNYRMTEGGPTDLALMHELKSIAEQYLHHVYLGNV